MNLHTPDFWKKRTWLSGALLPLAWLYYFFAALRRKSTTPYKVSVPVICIGNAVVGGSGKTPVALALGELLKAQGKNVHFLSRGYKGKFEGPVRVDLAHHTAHEVGDEPLLLADILPTWVSKNRVAGARAAVEAGAELIIMDDGFQNPTLHKDVSLLVIDGGYGFGNGRLLPSGPLREPLGKAFARADGIVFIGEDAHGILPVIPGTLPIIRADIEPLPAASALKGVSVVAFAGIAQPQKFFATLHQLGADIRHRETYPDHYNFTPRDLAFLRSKAQALNARLLTTSKDYARLAKQERSGITAVPIVAVFKDGDALLKKVLSL